MRIGLLGGTFDPVHYGHLVIAEQAREQAELDQVWFLPSARPPHKLDQEVASFERRVEMLALALAGQEEHFRIETIEKERNGPSYTADTLEALSKLHPQHEWFLIVGADCLPDLPHWHEPHRILDRGFDGLVLWEQLFQRAGHIAHVGFDGVMQQTFERKFGRDDQADQVAVLGHAVEVLGVAGEAAQVSQCVRNVLNLDVCRVGLQEVEVATTGGEDGGVHVVPFGTGFSDLRGWLRLRACVVVAASSLLFAF